MAKYMFTASYSVEGARGLLKEGGSARRDVLAKGLEALGGRLEVFYYTFGKHDVIGIGDVPDNVTAAALSLTIGASGGASVQTTVLLTPEEIDAATRMAVSYRAPGA